MSNFTEPDFLLKAHPEHPPQHECTCFFFEGTVIIKKLYKVYITAAPIIMYVIISCIITNFLNK